MNKSRIGVPILAGVGLGAAIFAGPGGLGPPLPALGFPEPAIVSRAWQFQFSHDVPRAIAVPDQGGQNVWYWYMPYKIVNHTDTERIFIPDITIATDRGDIIPAGRGVPSYVFAAIKTRIGNSLLERPDQMVDRVLRGEDHARESVVVWPASALDESTSLLSIFISGLSGETAIAKNPVTGESIALRRTLMLDFQMPGRPVRPQDQPVVFAGERWVMR